MEEHIRSRLDTEDKEHASGHLDKELAVSCRQFFTSKVEFHESNRPDSHLEHLQAHYKPLNKPLPSLTGMENGPQSTVAAAAAMAQCRVTDGAPQPKRILFDGSLLKLTWSEPRKIGAGLSNLGNTCFLNSVLQCLTYTPPLVNFLNSQHHSQTCITPGFCAMCAFHKHCTRVFAASGGVQKPLVIVQNMKAIGKHFRLGRQEDAHEFLRYFIDGFQKSCLHGQPAKLDPHSKATTVVHQIFGGYHRSQVKCLRCMQTSDTFDPLLDVSLDIKNCSQLTRALEKSTKPDKLDGENRYACPFCKQMTQAQKRFTIHRLPRVLTLQLKRFDYHSMFGGKINKEVAYPEHLDMRPYMSDTQGGQRWYQLYGVLVHSGYSCHAGHYTCFIRNSNGFWYSMNDAQVTQVSKHTALRQEAYLLFYIRDDGFSPPSAPPPPGAPLPAANKNQSLPKIYKEDPNFLGTSVKRPGVGVDKTGTPLVRVKPTGIVPPSPHSTPGQQPASIPLRKTSFPPLNKPKAPEPSSDNNQSTLSRKEPCGNSQKVNTTADDVTLSSGQTQAGVPRPLLNPAFIAPAFTPRSLSSKHRASRPLGKASVSAKGKLPPLSRGNGRSETPSATQPSSSLKEDTVSRDTAQIENSLTVLDIADMTHPPAPPTLSPPPNQTNFIGPLLPPQLQQKPSSPGRGESQFPPIPGKSQSPKVALVAPQPHHVSTKPVARVPPSPQVRPESLPEASKKKKNTSESGIAAKIAGKGLERDGGRVDNNGVALLACDTVETLDKSSCDLTLEPKVTHTLPSLSITPLSKQSSHKHGKKHRSKPSAQESSSESEREGGSLRKEKSSVADTDSKRDYTPKKKQSESKQSRRSRSKVSDSSIEQDRRHKKHKKHRHRSPAGPEEAGSPSEMDSHHLRSRHGRHSKSGAKRHRSASSGSDHSPSPHRSKSSKKHVSSQKRKSRIHRSHRKSRRDSTGGDSSSDDSLSRSHRRCSSEPKKHKTSRKERSRGREGETTQSCKERQHSSDRHRKKDRHSHHASSKRRDSSMEEEPHIKRREKHHHRDSSNSTEEGGDRKKDKRESLKSEEDGRKNDRHHCDAPKRDSSSTEEERRGKKSRHRHDSSTSAEEERLKRKRSHSHRGEGSPSHKRHKSDESSAQLSRHKKLSPVPEVEWDAVTRGNEAPPPSSRKWDGARHNETVEQLTSHTHSKLGSQVLSWEGGENSVDAAKLEGEGEGRRKGRDVYEQELDRGRIKKVHRRAKGEMDGGGEPLGRNPFQELQDKRASAAGSHSS